MFVTQYLKRLGVMLCVILPLTIVAIAMISADATETPSVWERILTVGFLFLLYGPVAASIVSLTHTFIENRLGPRRGVSVLIGVALGMVVVTPLVLNPDRLPALLYGAVPGGLYVLLVHRMASGARERALI